MDEYEERSVREGAECFQGYTRGTKPPKVLSSAISGYEWANPELVSYDPLTNTNTYRYTIRKIGGR